MVDEALEELSAALQEVSVAGEQLREQNDELLAGRMALEAERQRYRDLFEFAPDGYLVTDAAGVIQEANRAVGDLLRVQPRFLVGKPLLLYAAEADHPAWHALLTGLQRGAAGCEEELQLRPRDGTPFPALLTVAAIQGAARQLTGIRWLVRDISERKRLAEAEHVLRQQAEALGAELEQKVADRTAELAQREADLRVANQALQAALAQLRQMAQFRRQFITDVSHELRTPLTNVIAYLDLLKRGRPEKHDYYLATLQREAELMRVLVEDLLVMVELDQGDLRLKLAQVDFNQMVINLARERADLTAARTLTLQTRLAPDLPLVMVDARMLRQALVNLLLDAAERCAHGGVITLRTRWLGEGRPPAEGTSAPAAESAESCPGPGAWLALSFEIVGVSTPNSGLRATICRQIVEKHGGALTQHDGATTSVATVWLPVGAQSSGLRHSPLVTQSAGLPACPK